MLDQIKGLHHVTSLASSAPQVDAFFTHILGLRRVKKTVNFDAPDVYHLYYGDEVGSPGTVMTYFPFPNSPRGLRGTGEVGRVAFAVPKGSLDAWSRRLTSKGVGRLSRDMRFGEDRLLFDGPDGDGFALVEVADDPRAPWEGSDLSEEMAIRGFHSTDMRLRDEGATGELLRFMGYEEQERHDGLIRYRLPQGAAADVIDIETLPTTPSANQGAGSVHHVAFAVEDRARQKEVRQALAETGYRVTPVIDRDYFWSIYFRTPGGVLFEVATNEPGFATDEDKAHLGEELKLPTQHSHLRETLERKLEPIG